MTTLDAYPGKTVGITAAYKGAKLTSNLTINPTDISAMAIQPNPAKSGRPVYLTVWLTCPAPAGGATIAISSDDPTLIPDTPS